jgi:hypothetical protein
MRTVLSVVALAAASSAFAICPLADIFTSTVGAGAATGDTTGGVSEYTITGCGFGTDLSPDQQVEFTAISAGDYTFDTIGTGHDTVLSIISTGDCATEIACNDDFSGLQSSVTVTLSAGETVLVNVDGYNGLFGPWVLNTTYAPPGVCAADFALGSAIGAAVATGDTTGGTNDFDGATCGSGQGSADVAYTWTAPADDTYTFSLDGSAYDTGMTLQSLTCSELACDDDGGVGTTSQITYTATAGEQLLIVVDGYSTASEGAYTLGIYDSSSCADADGDGVCDASDLCTGDDATGDSDLDGVCDDTDFVLSAGTFTRGSPVTLGVQNAEPGSRAVFLLSTTGPGSGPCHPTAGICADIRGPIRVLGSSTVSGAGNASITITVPASAPAGRPVAIQAAYIGSGADVTEVETRTIN